MKLTPELKTRIENFFNCISVDELMKLVGEHGVFNMEIARKTNKVVIDTLELRCSNYVGIDLLLHYLSEAKEKKATYVSIILDQYSGEVDFEFYRNQIESDEEYEKRKEAIKLVQKIELERLQRISKHEEETLTKERELYEALKLKFEPEDK